MAAKSFLPLSACLLALLLFSAAWKTDRKPKIYGKRLSSKHLNTDLHRVRKRILSYHNYYRSSVKPQASNMLRMTWMDDAAKAAQKWAESCQLLTHDSIKGRWTRQFGSCGQNIFISTHKVPWVFAVKTWFLEKQNFTYGSPDNELPLVGHYTQLAWASSHRLGCGVAKCNHGSKGYFNYVCNYCPIGNIPSRLGRPYEAGEPCSGCRDSCQGDMLCDNHCPVADFWVNCRELNATWHDWLCESDKKRKQACRATCFCGTHRIH
ncbi:unnamed protein product [Darwinula stevensoni]|uniref:SCP domain-containing protein n=1 Tax=Darwinula stevensoni TaxID=69355 RepID=A0A7R8XBV5_9CRUS|nr:unnamed protein product [Darwinula stevensoni]CAG0891560.1 unnamed protein product [Darwinula stevensoni]